MCNCNTSSNCNNCCKGIPCACPPVYTVPTSPVECTNCCPPGYRYVGGSPNTACECITTGCVTPRTATIPCNKCEDSYKLQCVFYDGEVTISCPTGSGASNIYGIVPGDNLATILSKMCIVNENVLEAMLSAIGNSTAALAGFCQLVAKCGKIPGTTTPIIGPITFTIP